jgi:Tol biopolymer transport system component
MADETAPGTEEQNADAAPNAPSSAPPAAAAAEEGAEAGPAQSWGGALMGLALLAVLLTIVGVFGQVQKRPNHLPLGLGLLLWGMLDLAAQRRGLIVWKGAKRVAGNTVNLLRGVALLGVGVWLCLMAVGALAPASTATVSTVGVVLLALYLGTALLLEVLVKGVKLSGHAFLLLSLGLILLSYLYFAIPFTYAWSAVFAGLAFAAAAWSVYAGVLEETPPLSRAVLIAVLALGTPQGVYTAQQMFFTAEQPLFTPTLLIPRMRQVVSDLGEHAGQLTWAPVHTQAAQPGDVPFSDKMAFTDRREHKPGVGLFLQQDDGKGQLAWLDTGEDARLAGFSPDGRLLALTQMRKGSKTPSLAVLEPVPPLELAAARQAAEAAALEEAPQGEDPKAKEARLLKQKAALAADLAPYRLKTLYSASVEESPEHGQVWRGLGKELYFSGPQGGLTEGDSMILRADLKKRQVTRLRSNRGMPAVSPDNAALLSVGFEPNERYLEMADGVEGTRDPRRFQHRREARYFPAWNTAQTRVLFLAPDGALMTMNSNGTNKRAFDPEDLDSKVWYSDKLLPFTLQWKESGDTYKVWRSKPDGTQERLIYEVKASIISPPQWSPDSRRVAFIVRQGGESSILTLGADGSWPRRFFTTTDSLSELKWGKDSLRLAWLCERADEGTHEVWMAAVDGMDPQRLYRSSGRLSHLDWSPQHRHVAVQETKQWRLLGLQLVKPDLHNVLMIDLSDRRARVMTRFGLLSRGPAFSPQGVAIGYFTDQRPWHPGLLRERSSALVISQLH